MTFGPFPSGHTVTHDEYNELVAAFDAEIVRATAAESALTDADTTLRTDVAAHRTAILALASYTPGMHSTERKRFIVPWEHIGDVCAERLQSVNAAVERRICVG